MQIGSKNILFSKVEQSFNTSHHVYGVFRGRALTDTLLANPSWQTQKIMSIKIAKTREANLKLDNSFIVSSAFNIRLFLFLSVWGCIRSPFKIS